MRHAAAGRLLAGLCLPAMATAALLTAAQPAPAPTVVALRRTFEAPPDEARVMMRWWWFGPSITPAGIDRDLEAMRAAGIGGVEVQPVYPLALEGEDDARRLQPFLSAAFLERLTYARASAARLGLRFDLTLGSGWPFGGPGVQVTDAAGALRIVSLPQAAGTQQVGLPTLDTGERLLAAYLTRGSEPPTSVAAFTRLDLSRARDGIVALPAPLVAAHRAWIFIEGRTGMMVKRPAVGGEGFVLDHYDRRALDRYLTVVGTPLLSSLSSSLPYAIFCDSLEVFGSDWTPGLPEAFERRHGYDLRSHLPALAIGDDRAARGVRHDWGQTLTELLETEFLTPLLQWTHERDTRLRVQTYGMPPARPSSGGLIDLPEGEGAAWRTVSATRWASSAAHVYGRPVASSETWTWLHSPSFAATPLDIKAEADRHFLQGITQLVGHGWPHTPAGVEWPGGRFYAAAVLSDVNPWWVAMPDVARYLQRTSALLRQGTPVTDVALYLPVDDAWGRMRPGQVHLFDLVREQVGPTLVASLLDAGLSFDVVDDRQLMADGRVEGDTLVVGAARYRAVVLPGVATMPAGRLDLLNAFARAGGVVAATRRAPSEAPGYRATPEQDAHVRRASARLFAGVAGAPTAAGVLVARDEDLGAALAARITPTVRWLQDASHLGFVQRRLPDADVFFVANVSNRVVTTTATLRTSYPGVEVWDPVSGSRRALTTTGATEARTVPLTLPPYGSVFLVAHAAADAERASPTCADPVDRVDLASGWTLQIGDAPPRALATLESWHLQPALRHVSDVGTYRREVQVPDAALASGCPVWLDFGEGTPVPEAPLTNGMRAWLDAPVRDGAVVRVNDQDVGAVWAPPYRIDLARVLRTGVNRLEIRVGNSALNRWSARPQPDYRLLHLRHGQRFDPQDLAKVEPQPSGLIGRPRLVY